MQDIFHSLSSRARSVLNSMNITTIAELNATPDYMLRRYPNCGAVTVSELRQFANLHELADSRPITDRQFILSDYT